MDQFFDDGIRPENNGWLRRQPVLNGGDSQRAWEHEKTVVCSKNVVEMAGYDKSMIGQLEDDRERIFHFETNGVPVFLFRDHDSAYNSWSWLEQRKGVGVSGMKIIHVDAHADMPWNSEIEKFPKPQGVDGSLAKVAGYSTYLIPAAVDGMVGSLYWLGAHRDVKQSIFTQTSLNRASVDVRRDGSGGGIPYYTSQSAESLVGQLRQVDVEQPFSLDLDIDYFLDGIYLKGGEDSRARFEQRLDDFISALREIVGQSGNPIAVTIAYSPAYCSCKEWATKVVESVLSVLT